ncbi:MAG TPA: MlaD family protein [Candidatus Binataceae bacterium]|nr:MlaD family protein [Candidatus Binataceae bacterium]
MATRRERTVVVGAFVAGTAVVLAIGILWLAGSRFLRPVAHYQTIFKGSVSGLLPGAAVELNGVDVGRVADVNLTDDSPPKVRVDLEVKPNTPIYKDTVAQLAGNFVTGIQFIQLTGGSRQSGELAEDEPIPSSEGSLFADVRKEALEVSQETYQLVRGLNEQALNAQNRVALGQTIQDLAATSKNLRALSENFSDPKRMKSLNSTLANLDRTSANLSSASDVFARRSGETFDRMNQVLAKLSTTADTAQVLFTSTNGLLSRNYQDIDRTVSQVSRVTRHLDEVVQSIQADPSVLIWGRKLSSREDAQ